MNPQQSPKKGFTSFRIIGKKAQLMLARARGGNDQRKKTTRLPKAESHPELLVHLSVGSIIRAAFVILAIALGAWIIFQIRDKIILLILAFFIATIADPGVQSLGRLGIPRGIAMLLQYFVAICLVIFLLVSLIPIIADQVQQIALLISAEVNAFLADPQISIPLLTPEVNARLLDITKTTLQNLSINQFTDALQQLGQTLSTAAQGSVRFAAQIAGSVVNFIMNFIVVLVLAFFIQIEKEKIRRWTRGFLPGRYRLYLDSKSDAIHFKIGQWARGQLILCLSIATLTFIALVILGMPYALTLAVLAGFTELIPVVGPLIAAIPSVLIALTQKGFVWAVVIAAVYYVIQWCENNLLVPLVMKRAVGLSPISILFAMLVGISFPETIHPVLGVILAIPATTVISIFLEDWRDANE